MINVTGVSKKFDKTNVLKDINLQIKEGEVFGIVGHSGAGKSTLLRCLNGLLTYDSGSIVVMGQEIKSLKENEIMELRKDLGMIFQNFNLLNRKNVYENVALPMQVWGYDKKTVKKRVDELLKLVGLEEKIYSMPKELSGGQKQRVAIARALSLQPKILLCDEATSALDPKTTKDILALLKDINEKLNITIVIVTHQMEVIKEICNRVVLMDAGEIKASGKVDELFLSPGAELKKLIGEDEDHLPNQGVNIRILFPKDMSEKCIITSMARELDMDFSIVWGKLEKFRNDVLGSLVINVQDNEAESIYKYLNEKNVKWEVM